MKPIPILTFISWIAIGCLSVTACNLNPAKPVVLTVSAAVPLTEVMGEIQELYKRKKPNVTITYNFQSSGFLRHQIEQGVPVDIYISGGTQPMDILQAKGLLIPETRKDIVTNSIVLIAPKDSTTPSNFQDLASERVKTVALGDPEYVAAGKYAEEVLTHLKLFDRVKPKAIFAQESIRQVLRYVETGSADAGIVYASEVRLSDGVRIVATAPENSHSPILFTAAVLKGCKNIPEAQDFLQFMFSDRAGTIFEKYGLKKIVKK